MSHNCPVILRIIQLLTPVTVATLASREQGDCAQVDPSPENECRRGAPFTGPDIQVRSPHGIGCATMEVSLPPVNFRVTVGVPLLA
jgi:hypothetical protein